MEKLESLVYLLELKQLESLDLSLNNFSYSSIPRFMGSMKKLRYLNLSSASFGGLVPYELGNLTNLRVLDLGSAANELTVHSLGWVSHLRELRYLNMSGVQMSYANDWMESVIGPLPYIRELHLSSCGLTLHNVIHKNSSFSARLPIRYLDLSINNFSGDIPRVVQNLTSLEHLDLSQNMLSGEIPAALEKLSNLEELDLSRNILSFIASSLRFPSNLKSLDLYGNQLSGKIPTSIGKLSKLKDLVICSNPWEGTVLSEPHFANLSSLIDINIEETLLTLDLPLDWVPPFQLLSFSASHCNSNGQIPPWLQTQKSLINLALSNANISGLMPQWFHTMPQLSTVDLSNNHLSGSPIFPINFMSINLCNNSLSGNFLLSNDSKTNVYPQATITALLNNFISGPLPESLCQIMPNLEYLDLDNNQISGPIPDSWCQLTSLVALYIQNNSLKGVIPNCWGLGQRMPKLEILVLSNNQIEGPIPDSLCRIPSLVLLDIGKNRLSGVIPTCWSNVSSFSIVNLSYNKLKGRIPCFNNRTADKLGFYDHFYLHLNDNMLSGEIPSCLSDLTNLKFLDIGGNQLSGKMHKWFKAEKFRSLKILRLRGNKFTGTIPTHICSLPYLQLIDLGHNHFMGSIPGCLSNLTAMTSLNASQDNFLSDVSEVIQGIERAYTSTLQYLVDIDLSCNNLVGSIPNDITKISGLLSLNLSFNQLSGMIPENIGGLKSLVSLDLSENKLRGSIPTSIGELYSLSHLNLSYNNLSGQIPTGNQLQTLSDQASIYAGNPYLCGDSLPKKCKSKVDKQVKGRSYKASSDNAKKFEKMGFGLVVMSGFATGFWGVVGCLVLNTRWRHVVFQRLEDMYNWLYVIVALRVAKINRR
ncbi:receptor-like protein EIX1 [Silene latifolia]|uniref:receptor-like protein EIX1 n=1 Tax=Silene latifolia TaxID=37657 RepID=UPI003D7823FA